MEVAVDGLLQRFERGAMSRRELVHALSVLALSVAGAPVAAQSRATGLKATGVGHLGLLCSDVDKSAAFYVDALGMTLLGTDKPKGIARVGNKGTIISLRQASPAGTVDHFALSIEGFDKDAVSKALSAHGVMPREDTDAGFHVKDPDGANVQLTA